MIYDQSINAGACTDKTWTSSSCFTSCPSSMQSSASNSLFRCSNNEWCCSAGGNYGNTTSCCDTAELIFTAAEMGTPSQIYNGSAWAPGFTLAPVSALSNESNSSNDTFPSATDTCTTNPPPQSSSTNKTKLGVSVGLGTGIPLVAALGCLLFLLAREKRANRLLRNYVNTTLGNEHPLPDFMSPVVGKQKFWAEMPGSDSEPKEMPSPGPGMGGGEPRYQELSSGTIRR